MNLGGIPSLQVTLAANVEAQTAAFFPSVTGIYAKALVFERAGAATASTFSLNLTVGGTLLGFTVVSDGTVAPQRFLEMVNSSLRLSYTRGLVTDVLAMQLDGITILPTPAPTVMDTPSPATATAPSVMLSTPSADVSASGTGEKEIGGLSDLQLIIVFAGVAGLLLVLLVVLVVRSRTRGGEYRPGGDSVTTYDGDFTTERQSKSRLSHGEFSPQEYTDVYDGELYDVYPEEDIPEGYVRGRLEYSM